MEIQKIYIEIYKEFKDFFNKNGIRAYKPRNTELSSKNDEAVNFDLIFKNALRELNIYAKIDDNLGERFLKFFIVGRIFFYNNFIQTHKIYLSRDNLEFITPEIIEFMGLTDKDFKDFYGFEPLKLEDYKLDVPENNIIPENIKYDLFDIYYKPTIPFMLEALDFNCVEAAGWRFRYNLNGKPHVIQMTTGLSGYFNLNRYTPKNGIHINEFITLIEEEEEDSKSEKVIEEYFKIWGSADVLTRATQKTKDSYISRLSQANFKFDVFEDSGWIL